MIAPFHRAALAAVVGALVAALCLVAAYTIHPGLTFEMDRPLPSFISGMHGSERHHLGSFAWTSDRVEAAIPGLDRQIPWSCTIRFRGARAEGVRQPTLRVDVDGNPAASMTASNEFEDVNVVVRPATTTGVSIVMNVTPTFTPGGGDPRVLGVQVDRFLCRPGSAVVRPPSNALAQASLAAGIFAAGLALVGLSLSSAMFAAAVFGLGQTVLMSMSSGLYGDYPSEFPELALWVVVAAFVVARVFEIWQRRPLSSSARFVLACSATVLVLKLAGLYHPAKPIIDAVFHAHRLEWVLAGNFFFTQPLPNGVQMPYAIGLYVFAAPWAWIASDYVALIRTVTASADVIAGGLLYPVVLAAWGDRRAAAFAVALYQLVPLPFTVLGNANLTNIFGQSAALATMAAATTWRLDPRRYFSLIGFTIVAAWALCSHVSTVTILSATLGALVVLYWWRGDAGRRRAALAIVIATTSALAFSWIVYYRHFLGVFRDAFALMFAGGPPADSAVAGAEVVKGYMTVPERVWNLLQQAVTSAGWPLLVLAALGIWSLARRRTHDRLAAALWAWGTVWVVFSASTVFARVDREYVRYAAEFLGRINLATVPLIAVLAARGAAAGWDPETSDSLRRPLQLAAIVLLAGTLILAVNAWLGWFSR
jgi:hypothetical protein